MTSIFRKRAWRNVYPYQKKIQIFRMKKWKTGLGLVWWRKNDCSSFLSNVTMEFALSFIKNDSLVAENHHFPGFVHLLRKVHLLMKTNGNRHLLKSYRKWCSKFSGNFTKYAIFSDIDWFSSDKDPKNERSVNFYTEYSRVYFFQKCLVVDKQQAERGIPPSAFRGHIWSGPL